MILHYNKFNYGIKKGFMALNAVILMALGMISFSLITLLMVVSFADVVNRHELRIQANLNLDACMETIKLMLAKDYFLNGKIRISEFGCIANISNNLNGGRFIDARTELNGIRVIKTLTII